MSKGEKTRQRVIEQTATLFNERGYFGASMADVMEVSGLKKGGIYRHFESKEELAREAFEYAVGLFNQRIFQAMIRGDDAVARLASTIDAFAENLRKPPLPGGCPVMNAAIEHDDGVEALRVRAQRAMEQWFEQIRFTVERGRSSGELTKGIEPDEVATILLAGLEGAAMLSRLHGDDAHMERAVHHLKNYVESLRA